MPKRHVMKSRCSGESATEEIAVGWFVSGEFSPHATKELRHTGIRMMMRRRSVIRLHSMLIHRMSQGRLRTVFVLSASPSTCNRLLGWRRTEMYRVGRVTGRVVEHRV